ncbi:MAG: 50S ribosomal protein L37e [Nanobdellota archaeon]
MGTGTATQGKHSGKGSHINCRRCGAHAYHRKSGVCAACGYGKSAKKRSYSWQKK